MGQKWGNTSYRDRLQNRKIKSRLEDLYHIKTQLWKVLLKDLENTVTDDWTEAELNKVIEGLKKNKTRDPHELINELFKPNVMGRDMKLALLNIFNQIKREKKVPQAFKFANISSIYKNKGSRQSLENDRGIFVVSTLRMILDSLIYQEMFPLIDKNM